MTVVSQSPGLVTTDMSAQTIDSSVRNALEKAALVEDVILIEVKESMYDKFGQIGTPNKDAKPGEVLFDRLDDDGKVFLSREPNTKLINVVYESGSSFTDNLTKKGIENVMMDVYEAIYTSGVPVSSVTVEAHMPLMDSKGNSSMGIIYGTRLNNNDAKGINWSNKRIISPYKTYFKNNAFK